MVRKKLITLDELAKELNLTKHTVSKALRGLPGMSLETRRTVCEYAEKRGYYTKEQKKIAFMDKTPSSVVHTYRFLFIVTSAQVLMESYTHYLLFQGLQDHFAIKGHQITMQILPPSVDSDQQFDSWIEQNDVLKSDGLFITPNTPLYIEQKLLALDLPRILLNFPSPDAMIDSVIWDVFDAAQMAVRYLLERGHKRILYIGNISQTRGYKLRWQAFQMVMQDAGHPIDSQDHLLDGSEQQDNLPAIFLEKYRSFQPTALISAGYNDLKWIQYACGSLQIQIPGNCSLISLSASPQITDVTRPIFLIKESGHRAADRMLWRIANPHEPYEHVRLISQIFEGVTVGRVNPGK
jgi:LacI family transcriptional regulator